MKTSCYCLFGPLPITRHGNNYILVITDFIWWVEAYILPNQEATTVARVLVNEWIGRLGALDAIHSACNIIHNLTD